MKHKARPTKSSRHKSVTFIIGSQTSFGSQQHQQRQQPRQQQQQQAAVTSVDTKNATNTPIKSHKFLSQHMRQHQNQIQLKPRKTSLTPTDIAQRNYGGSSAEALAAAAAAAIASTSSFQQNLSHMDDVMRLAFLENNDISPDDCSNIDFNSPSHQALAVAARASTSSFQHNHIEDEMRFLDNDDMSPDECSNIDFNSISHQALAAAAAAARASTSSFQHSHMEDEMKFLENNDVSPDEYSLSAESIPLSHRNIQQHPIQDNGDGFLCDEPGCGKSFPSLRKLRHHKVVHSDEFPFVCEFPGCGKKFKRKFGIDLHSTTHFDLDQKMYKKTSNNSSLPFFGRRMQYSMCKPCGQKFKTVHEYQYHMSKHGKEPFKCPVKGCGQTFGIWKSFQKHRASHYFNYYCMMDPQCDHHTSNLQLLKLHIYCCHYRRKLPEYSGSSNTEELE